LTQIRSGFYEDYSSGNAVAALQAQLAPTCKCLRDGQVQAGTPSVDLVPGDVVLLRLGDVVPADCYLLDDGDSLKIDQSSLTGESLPVNRYPADEVYSGSIGTITRTRTRTVGVCLTRNDAQRKNSETGRDDGGGARDGSQHVLRQGGGARAELAQEEPHSRHPQGHRLLLYPLRAGRLRGRTHHPVCHPRQALHRYTTFFIIIIDCFDDDC
jgi:hypothetical protein